MHALRLEELLERERGRLEDWLDALTLEEKVSLCAGSDAWHSVAIPRLGIPALKLSDGPNGVRGDGRSGTTSACFPVGIALGATWNVELIEAVAGALGEEARSKGVHVLLGPTVNLQRHPLAGRHFECYSEDPHLSSRIAVAFIRGVQSRRVAACVKHFVCNDSEFERHSISSEVSEEVLREIYLPPFEAAVKEADAWSLMSAYNRINGTFAASHTPLLRDLLKDEWDFRGLVVSDWGGATETVACAKAGLDLEMPGPPRVMGEKLSRALCEGSVDESEIDDKVRRLLGVALASGAADSDLHESAERSENRPEHRALARRAAAESIVLVRNENILPLDATKLRSLALIGPNARRSQIQGGGSSVVRPHYEVHPLAALRERLGPEVEILHEAGCEIEKYCPAFEPAELCPGASEAGPGLLLEYWNGEIAAGPCVESRVVRRCRALWMGRFSSRVDPRHFSARYSGTWTPSRSGRYCLGLQSAGEARLRIDEELLLATGREDDRGDGFFGRASLEDRIEFEATAGREYRLGVEFESDPALPHAGLQFGALPPETGNEIERAVEAARRADLALVVVGTSGEWESEGNDRRMLRLPGRQDELVERILAARPDSVVILNTGSPVELDWLDRCGALLQTWFAGQESGHALGDVLFGDLDPSGRMPCSWPRRLEDTPSAAHYPGRDGRVHYREGLAVGYRGYDRSDLEPLIPFGHGLSYTQFEYLDLTLPPEVRAGESVEISIRLRNRGERRGQEVVQLYLGSPPGLDERPPRELRAFSKSELGAGEEDWLHFSLDARALSVWAPDSATWCIPTGEREILVGASSRDIRARGVLRVMPRAS
jgi:beta-glucosidase